jgi:hypothetical protein
MKLLRLLSLCLFLSASLTVTALANPTVTSPYNGSTVSSPFTLTASSSSCSSQSISSIGYSLDSSSTTTTVSGGYLQKSVSASTGGHTIHVKAWGNAGAICVTDVAVTVSSSTSSDGISVSTPTYGATVTSPFNLSASASSCSGQAVASMGYSLDASTSTVTESGTLLSKSVSIGTGGHTVHVKSWGKSGASCVTNVAVTVSGTSTSTPSYATNLSNLQASGGWSAVHDAGSSGSSSGWTGLTSSPSRSGNARHLSTSYTDYGGERYSTSFSDNTSAHNFVYDAWVYIKDTALGAKSIEMDLNQVIGNGWTVIMGMQCDGWSGTWDFTANKGSATSPNDQWIHSGVGCHVSNWGVNAWHHIQIAYYRDDYGYVTYKTVALDGVTHTLNARVFSGFALGWGKTIITNFQVDGGTSYSYGSNLFLDDLNVSYW